MSMGESINELTPLPISRATGPSAVCVPGIFKMPAAFVGEVALVWLVSRTQPRRVIFSSVGEICQVSCAVGKMVRWGVVSTDIAFPLRIEISPEATTWLYQ